MSNRWAVEALNQAALSRIKKYTNTAGISVQLLHTQLAVRLVKGRLYEDNVTGKLADERFAKLSAAYEQEQAELKQSVERLSALVETAEAQAVNIKSFLKIVKKYTEPTELTPQLLHEFVEKIVVHEADKSSGHCVQRIDVHYNFIGEIEFFPEYCRKKDVTA